MFDIQNRSEFMEKLNLSFLKVNLGIVRKQRIQNQKFLLKIRKLIIHNNNTLWGSQWAAMGA